VLGEDGAVYPAYAACSQSPGGTWTNTVGGGPTPGAYMGHQSPVPGTGATVVGAGTPQSSQQQGGATPQAALPSPLYPWMRSQFGELMKDVVG